MSLQKQSWSSARNICIVKTLAKLGHYPTRISEKEAWFLSPLRSETQASFTVSLVKNYWFDFGEGKGGNVIDLVMLLLKCNFQEGMLFLAEHPIPFSFCPKTAPVTKNLNKTFTITGVKFLTHPAIIKYVESRGIPIQVARMYCREVWYSFNARKYFALGLQNDKGGFELRNIYYKSSTSPKTYTYRKRNSKTLLITEGMFDFLSLVTLEEDMVNNSDTIILNSLAFTRDIEVFIPKYNDVLLFLDNDPAGDKATKSLLHQFTHITDQRRLYKNYKDLNDKLRNEKRNNIQREGT